MNNSKLTHSVLQHPTDLVFAVTDIDVAPLLTILKTQTITISDYAIQLSIIGESHCITVSHKGQFVMQEILACTDIPEILQAHSHKFAKLESYQHTKPEYRGRVWFTNRIQGDQWTSECELILNFPEMYGQIPFTKIQWMTSETSFQWRTVHVYPLQTHTTYVYTESFFDLTERNNNE
jgi:hypothetical protein